MLPGAQQAGQTEFKTALGQDESIRRTLHRQEQQVSAVGGGLLLVKPGGVKLSVTLKDFVSVSSFVCSVFVLPFILLNSLKKYIIKRSLNQNLFALFLFGGRSQMYSCHARALCT